VISTVTHLKFRLSQKSHSFVTHCTQFGGHTQRQTATKTEHGNTELALLYVLLNAVNEQETVWT